MTDQTPHSVQNTECPACKFHEYKAKFVHLCQGGSEHVDDVADYADHGEADKDD